MKSGSGSARVIIGFLGILAGSLLLLVSNGIIRTGALLVPLGLLGTGIALFSVGTTRDGREGAVFPGAFLTLLAIFLVLRATILSEVAILRIWPVFLSMAGIALFVYAWNKGPDFRLVIGVPAVFIIVLSIVFLLFSMDVVRVGFLDFVLAWWPFLLVFAGIITLWSHYNRQSGS